ncbi:MAG: translational GTPase TypA [Gemmatimonadetes bacterium]|nr:translational GTPase TypA [Gemmatimonadota bacterium]
MSQTDRIRNIGIIAHIDHGKTTLIDAVFRAAHVFRENARVEERVMDSYDLERERGITIRAKHCAVEWGGYRINIVDTPGHADFSGEVERVLGMVDSVLLLVDAAEGPMPQTRYVLLRALRRGLRPIVIINKVDRESADPVDALHRTFDLFVELGADDEQADFPVLYGSGLHGWFVRDLERDGVPGMAPLFETIIEHVPPPRVRLDAPFRMQVSTLAWSDYVGRIGCGRVLEGVHRCGEPVVRTTTRWTGPDRSRWEVVGSHPGRSAHLWVTRGLERAAVEEIAAGDIVWMAGLEDVTIGDTISAVELEAPALAPLEIEEPTVSMYFLVNTGPFAGEEGDAVTLRQLRARLERELKLNVALRMEDVGRPDGVKVSGRGELHLAVLIEEMRREGIEFCVSRPEVITVTGDDGALLEPLEQLVVELPQEHHGIVFEKLARRRGELKDMRNAASGFARLEFEIPTRGLIGYRTEFLTDTRGLGLMASRFVSYGSWRGPIATRSRGSMISTEAGEITAYALEGLQSRGTLFLSPMERVYAGMIVGEHSRPDDLPCNPAKKKHLTNYRVSTREVEAGLKAPLRLSLDAALEWIADDELVEVTPRSVRVRKAILSAEARKRAAKRRAALATAG